MCCCDKPTVNGRGLVRMTPESAPSNYDIEWRAPSLIEGDVLLYDEPGRCGGLDAHSHHFRLVRNRGSFVLLVKHGGGEKRTDLLPHQKALTEIFESLDSNGRYWLLHTIYNAHHDGHREGCQSTAAYWRKAAAEKRIKVRKVRGSAAVKVTVTD